MVIVCNFELLFFVFVYFFLAKAVTRTFNSNSLFPIVIADSRPKLLSKKRCGFLIDIDS